MEEEESMGLEAKWDGARKGHESMYVKVTYA